MFFYIIRRLVAVVAMLFVISIATFLLFYAGPNDPARLTCAKNCTPATVEANRHALGLDKPIAVQYGAFLKGLVSERSFPDDPVQEREAPQTITKCAAPCLGYSFVRQTSVSSIIADALPVTVSLAVGAFVLWMVVGVTSGVIAALRRGTFVDRGIVGVALIGFSLPTFFIGLLLLNFVAIKWQLVPYPNYTPFFENPAQWAVGLILPWITLAAVYAASYVRLTRAYMLETMSEDYIRTARAKGVREGKVVRRHGLRAALTPIVTAAGLDLGGLLGGVIITEAVFNLNGLGRAAVQAVTNVDLPTIVGLVLVAAFFVVIANLIVDVLYGVIDPRVRLS
jgi:peptide/nickel transport system permease protein